jgi:hypothetical protein
MGNVFVIQTDDKEFKEAMSIFLSKHCKEKDVNAAVYEMNNSGAEEVMNVVREKIK